MDLSRTCCETRDTVDAGAVNTPRVAGNGDAGGFPIEPGDVSIEAVSPATSLSASMADSSTADGKLYRRKGPRMGFRIPH